MISVYLTLGNYCIGSQQNSNYLNVCEKMTHYVRFLQLMVAGSKYEKCSEIIVQKLSANQ